MTALYAFTIAIVAYLSQVTGPVIVESKDCPPNTWGYADGEKVTLCTDSEPKLSREEIINHETIHLIQTNLDVDLLMPEQMLNFLVHSTLDEAEILQVILFYGETDYMGAEFEARVLSKLPTSVIMMMYSISEDYVLFTSGTSSVDGLPVYLQ